MCRRRSRSRAPSRRSVSAPVWRRGRAERARQRTPAYLGAAVVNPIRFSALGDRPKRSLRKPRGLTLAEAKQAPAIGEDDRPVPRRWHAGAEVTSTGGILDLASRRLLPDVAEGCRRPVDDPGRTGSSLSGRSRPPTCPRRGRAPCRRGRSRSRPWCRPWRSAPSPRRRRPRPRIPAGRPAAGRMPRRNSR